MNERKNYATVNRKGGLPRACHSAIFAFQRAGTPLAIRRQILTATARSATTHSIEQLGSRVRYARKRNELTLKELGDKVGCSESLLSKMERNHIVPSLPVLWRIAEALGTTFGALFGDESVGPVTTYNSGERPLLSLGTGTGKMPDVVLERMVPSADNRTIDANLHVIPPGGGSSGAYSHSGEEVGYVVSGYLELTVDGRVYLLAGGGSFFFNSSLPHSYRNVGTSEARVVWMNSHKSRLR